MTGSTQATRTAAAVIGAGLVLGAVLLIVRSIRAPQDEIPSASSGNSADPTDCVAAMIVAERAGDVDAYLECFSGPQLGRVEAQMAAQTTEKFAAQLRREAADLTGHAVSNLEHEEPDAAVLLLERIFPKHNERHRIQLRKVDGAWKIVDQTSLGLSSPEIPYGTPVVPEGDGAVPGSED